MNGIVIVRKARKKGRKNKKKCLRLTLWRSPPRIPVCAILIFFTFILTWWREAKNVYSKCEFHYVWIIWTTESWALAGANFSHTGIVQRLLMARVDSHRNTIPLTVISCYSLSAAYRVSKEPIPETISAVRRFNSNGVWCFSFSQNGKPKMYYIT